MIIFRIIYAIIASFLIFAIFALRNCRHDLYTDEQDMIVADTENAIKPKHAPSVQYTHDNHSGFSSVALSTASEIVKPDTIINENSDNYFDISRYMNRKDKKYVDKVNRHYKIANWMYCNKKDDPSLRRIICLLLENGYDIEDYDVVAKVIIRSQYEINMIKHSYENAEIFSSQEIERVVELSGAYRRQRGLRKIAIDIFNKHGITDKILIEQLLSIDTGLIMEHDAVCNSRYLTIYGDSLLTDVDWLDEEFVAAKSTYIGENRGTTQERLASWFDKIIESRRKMELLSE